MQGQVALEVVGHINVAARKLPEDMEPGQRAIAQQRRVQDILIVLERQREALEARIGEALREYLPDGLGPAEVRIGFDDAAPSFSVEVAATGLDDIGPGLRELELRVAEVARSEFLACIAERATSRGLWEAIVLAEPKPVPVPSKAKGRRLSWLGLGLVLAALGVVAVYLGRSLGH